MCLGIGPAIDCRFREAHIMLGKVTCGDPMDVFRHVRAVCPSFSRAAPPEEGLAAFNAFVTALRGEGLSCPTGEFGAHMRVSLVNDGPATFSLHLRADGAGAD